VFTHDSIFLGEDGPTHQSIEHVAALRLIPNTDVWRPADGVECAAAWAAALQRKNGPTEIVLSRQKLTDLGAVNPDDAARGAYVLVREQGGPPDVVFIATGSEVGPALEAAKLIGQRGKRVRVVSAPCLEVFLRQDAAYRASVLPRDGRRVSVEAGRTSGWQGWVGLDGLAIGVDTFGASAPAKVLAEKYGLTGPQIAARVAEWL
jgi:transketolase